MFANFDDVLSQHGQAFEGTNAKDQFTALSTKLGELGYDMLLNNKKDAEFVPASRLNDVVGQRDTFKGQVETLNADLQKMKDDAKGNETLQGQIQTLMDTNNNLLKDLEKTKINAELMVHAKDAIDAKDVLAFVDFNNIKVNAKGEVLGVEGEIARIKQAKPYLFGSSSRKAGIDSAGGAGGDERKGSMNAMIRRAAGRV